MKLKTLTVADIRALAPCYDPTKFVKEDWQGTIIDILDLEGPSPKDKIWVVRNFLSDKINRLFAVWCAREYLKLVKNPDIKSIEDGATVEFADYDSESWSYVCYNTKKIGPWTKYESRI